MFIMRKIRVSDAIIWIITAAIIIVGQNIYIPVGFLSVLVYCLYVILFILSMSRFKGYSIDEVSENKFIFKIQGLFYDKETDIANIESVNFPYINLKNGEKITIEVSKKKFNEISQKINEILNTQEKE